MPPSTADAIALDSRAATGNRKQFTSNTGNPTNARLDTLHYESADEDFDYPEGGVAAWSVVLGAWCAMIPRFGLPLRWTPFDYMLT